jgi:uridine phosphorylase
MAEVQANKPMNNKKKLITR